MNLDEDLREAREDLVDAVSGLDKPAETTKTDSVAEKPPKFEDYDEMLDAYHQEKAPSPEKAEEAPASKNAEDKERPEAPVEKDRNG